MDLKESARQYVLNSLPANPADAELIAYLNGLDAHQLLIVYRNWMSRNVQQRRRTVEVSQTLSAKLLSSPHKPAVDAIIADIQNGELLKKYLSRGVAIAAQIPRADAKFQRRRDLDLMLTSWQMHHMHLGQGVDPDGFVTRTGDLLFVVFRPDVAYLVDIMPHGSWSSDRLLEIVVRELPNSGAAVIMQGVKGLARQDSETEAQRLRNAAINSPREIGGRVVMPTGMMSMAGTSIQSIRAADDAIGKLEAFEANWADNSEGMRQFIREHGGEIDADPEFVFHITNEYGAGLLELKSGTFVPFEAFG